MRFKYIDYNGKVGFCDVAVHNNVVVVTQLNDQQAASITNCAEIIATAICRELKIKHEELVYVERYMKDATGPTRCSAVKFDTDTSRNILYNPSWTRIADLKAYIVKHKISKSTQKKVNNANNSINNGETLVLPEITFIKREKFMETNKVESNGASEYRVNNMLMYKIGHFRGDFDSDIGGMWLKWHPGEYSEKVYTNPGVKAEIEAIMTRLKTQIFVNFPTLREFCYASGSGEKRFMGIGAQGFYVLHLIPQKGDYNLYLHGYSI